MIKTKNRFLVPLLFLLIIITSFLFVSNSVKAATDKTLPVATLTSPSANSTLSGTATLTATATDNVAVVKVEFYRNSKLLGTVTAPPYKYGWNTVGTVANGTYPLSVKAYDAAGNIGISPAVSVHVNNSATKSTGGSSATSNSTGASVSVDTPDVTTPTISLTSPSAGTVSGVVTISATATDNVGVTKVEFYRGSKLLTTVTIPPYTYSWNTLGNTAVSVKNGTYPLSAKAYDAAGNKATSAAVSVTIINSTVSDTTPPIISSVSIPATSITSTGATITWTTDENSTSQVEYGTTSTYGSTTSADSTPVTTHSVTFSGLNANTKYHFHVISIDGSGNKAVSDDNTFTTSAPVSLCNAQSTGPKTYYIDNTPGVGNDDNDGLCMTTPWSTIDKVNTMTFNSGDSILFKKGDTFHGGLVIQNSGVTIGAYGNSGNNPVITGLTSIPDGTAGWNNLGGGIWESKDKVSNLPTLSLVVINGNDTPMGRWPDKDDMKAFSQYTYPAPQKDSKGKAIYSCDYPYSITSATLSGSPTSNWGATAELVVYDTKFSILRSPVCSQSGTTIKYKIRGGEEPDDNEGFFIQNDPATLSKNNEWYYNPTSGKLQVYNSGGAPSGVQVADVDTLLRLNNASNTITNMNNITVDSISFRGSNGVTIDTTNPSYTTIQNSSISLSGNSAIVGRSIAGGLSDHLTIKNNSLTDIHNNGIDIQNADQNNPSYKNLNVSNNKLSRIGMIPGMGRSGKGNLEGISLGGNNVIVDHNILNTIGMVGIYFNGNNVTVSDNLIDGFDIVRRDSGAIYTWNSSSTTLASDIHQFSNQFITNNIVLHGGGDSPTSRDHRDGIYLDNNTNHVTVTGNTVAYVDHGMIINYGNKNIVAKNNLFYSALNGIDINACKNKSITENIDFENNISVSDQKKGFVDDKKAGQQAAAFFFDRTPPTKGCDPTLSGMDNGALKNLISSRNWTVKNNIYARPLNDTDTIWRDFSSQFDASGNLMYARAQSLADWQTQSGVDIGSHKSPIATDNASDIIFRYNASDSTSNDFSPSGNYIDLNDYLNTMNNSSNSCVTHSGNRTIPSWSSNSTVWTGAVLIKGSCSAARKN